MNPSTSTGLCVIDSQGEILFTSQGWKDLFLAGSSPYVLLLESGVRLGELRGVPPTDPAALIQLGTQAVLSGERSSFSFEFTEAVKRMIRIEITPLDSVDRGCQVVAQDISQNLNADSDGSFFTRLEKLTSEASIRLTHSSSVLIDENIRASLQEVGRLVGVDYAFVARIEDGKIFSMTHFWHSDAPADFHDRFQRVPIEENPFQEKLFANQSFVMTSADRLPDRYRFYRERCLAYGVKSLAGVPIFVEGTCVGYVGFVSTGKHRLWTDREIMILRVLSEIFSAAFLRQRIESSLRDREKGMFAFYRETENPVWCFAYHPPIPIHLPVEKQCELIWQSRFEDGNDAAANLIGLKSKEELIGTPTSDLFGKPSESYHQMLRNYIRDGYRCINARVEVDHPDGSVRTWLHQGQGVVRDGKLYRSWVSTRDITDHAKTEDSAAKSDDGQYRNSSLTVDEIQTHELMIGKIMKVDQPYLDPNFNLSKLARLARLPDYQVSQVLNMGMKTSFYDLVNRYRIEHLVRLLSSPECKSEGILDLAFRVGFNSKSTFNTAFKKIMGITPSNYRMRIQSRRDSQESPEP